LKHCPCPRNPNTLCHTRPAPCGHADRKHSHWLVLPPPQPSTFPATPLPPFCAASIGSMRLGYFGGPFRPVARESVSAKVSACVYSRESHRQKLCRSTRSSHRNLAMVPEVDIYATCRKASSPVNEASRFSEHRSIPTCFGVIMIPSCALPRLSG